MRMLNHPFAALYICLCTTLALCIAPQDALAVRPFVTDDARISDVGQVELETWTEVQRGHGDVTVGQHVMFGASPTEWLQVLAGTGGGRTIRGGEWTWANPVIQPKLLVWRAYEDGFPGLAFSGGVTLPFGQGAYFDPAAGGYLIAMTTTRLKNDWLLLHANLGATFAAPRQESITTKPYWGIGMDLGVFHHDLRIIAEAYSGDPFEALGPNFATQVGFRWIKSDHVNLDMTFGAQPEQHTMRRTTGAWEMWGQLGVRLLFDAFTPEGRAGDPLGGRGLTSIGGRTR